MTIFLLRSTKYCTCHENEPQASEVLRLPHRIIMISKATRRQFHKTRLFWPFQNVVQVHQMPRAPRKMTSKSASHFDQNLPRFLATCRKFHACHVDEKHVWCPAPVTQYTIFGVLTRLPHDMDIVRRDLRKSAKRDGHFVPTCAIVMHMDISPGNFDARICNEKPGARERTLIIPDLTPAFEFLP